ncbi:actin-binding WH2 domain-containing protein [candidate division KSB1 bacterium]|nr:actin-binding WH2 domain-containing protein [candidate division KSB1 bacterium]
MNPFSLPFTIIQNREAFFKAVEGKVDLGSKISSLLMAISVFFAVYGFIIGAFNGVLQAISAGIKLPIFYLLTLIVCFPTLYVFGTLFGSNKSFGQYFVLLLSAIAVISVILLGFAPVTFFFMITTDHYLFFKILNVTIFSIAGVLGLTFFYQGMRFISQDNPEGIGIRAHILKLWIILYGFVGSQLGWTLRPFFGAPDQPFQIFRKMGGNFYIDVLDSIKELLR